MATNEQLLADILNASSPLGLAGVRSASIGGLPINPMPPGPPTSGPGVMPALGRRAAPAVALPETAPAMEPMDRVAAFQAALNQGAQGQPSPSYAPAAADRSTRISQLLGRAMERQMETDPFARITEAAQRAAGGRMSFDQALREVEGQDVTRAYNIANAFSALARRGGGELTAKDLLGLQARQTEQQGRMERAEAQLFQTAASRISQDYGPEAATAFTRRVVELGQGQPSGDMAAATRLIEQARSDVANRFQPVARGARAAAPAPAAEQGGIVTINGQERFTPYQQVGNRPLTPLQMQFNDAVRSGDQVRARSLYEEIGKTGRPASQGDERRLNQFRGQLAAARTSVALMDAMRRAVDERGAAIMGATGGISQFLTGLSEQAQALIGMNDVRERVANANASFRNELLASPDTQSAFRWLSADNSAQATALKSNLLILGTSFAKSLDPAGRLSNQDVQQALAIIGSQGPSILNNPTAMKSALQAAENYITRTLESDRETFPAIGRAYPERLNLRPQAAPQPAAAPPQRTFPAPSQDAIRALLGGAGTDAQFDAIFGPGAAQRARGGR